MKGMKAVPKCASTAPFLFAVMAALAAGPLASAHLPRETIDLKTRADVRIEGAGFVAAAGDVNGDGHADLIVSRGELGYDPSNGQSWVVFGGEDLASVDLAQLGNGGFLIDGADPRDFASQATGVGDVNGDGLDDVIVGASGADNNERGDSGTAYVVFGKTDSDTVDLSHFDLNIQLNRGFRIDGPSGRALAGRDTAAAGDINKDGLDDVIVGAPFAGATYVVFGKSTTDPIDLLTFETGTQGSAGYMIRTPSPSRDRNYSVGGVGDVNGDGTGDIAIGVMATNGSDGSVFVMHGQVESSPQDVKEREGEGFRIRGTYSGSQTGYVVDGAGDANGDGFDDVIVGAPGILLDARGDAYVVFGSKKTDTVRLSQLGRRGYRIMGRSKPTPETLGISVSGFGDYNLDGLDDIVVSAVGATWEGRRRAGAAYVVFGKENSRTVRSSDLGKAGLAVIGPRKGTWVGSRVASPGDLNGDGQADLALGDFPNLVYGVFMTSQSER